MSESDQNCWASPEHALSYLGRADTIPHRAEGEGVLVDFLPSPLRRVLDLGSGDGRLLHLVKRARPEARAVALDFSPTMLERLQARFDGDPSVQVVMHDLNGPLPPLGVFDAVISSFAIHHVTDARKRALYQEVFHLLHPGGVFCNLEHVSSPSEPLHMRFLNAMGIAPGSEDPSNKLAPVEVQLAWLREIGFADVDCAWKWLELALLTGVRPA